MPVEDLCVWTTNEVENLRAYRTYINLDTTEEIVLNKDGRQVSISTEILIDLIHKLKVFNDCFDKILIHVMEDI